MAMHVKGTAFLARRAMLAQEIGEERTAQLVEWFTREYPDLPRVVLATTSIPFPAFIAFNEMLVRDVYGGDVQSYWRFGERSDEWALTAGPYKHIAATRSVAEFAATGRLIYQNYFTEGRAETAMKEGSVDLRLLDIAAPDRHEYLEYAIVGYFKRGLELVGARAVTATRVKGFSRRDPEVHYRYTLG